MSILRSRNLRDAFLVVLGATVMHILTTFVGSFSDNFTGDIIVNTHFNNAPAPLFDDSETSLQIHTPSTASLSIVDVSHYIPETVMDSHAPGWTLFHNLYMSNGTLFVVTNQPRSAFPELLFVTSTGLAAENTPENIAARLPTAKDLDFITPADALARWGPFEPTGKNRLWNVKGNTVLVNEPRQFLDHYYHFCAELLVGVWSFWSGAHHATPNPLDLETSSAPPLDRLIFAHADSSGWRDKPGFNGYFLRSAFPSLTVEVEEDWEDRINATSGSGSDARAWHFDSVLLSDRSAAFKGDMCGGQVHRPASEALHHMLKVGNLTKYWWEPVRRAVLRFSGVEREVMDIGVRADKVASTKVTKPMLGGLHHQIADSTKQQDIVITYISRQGVRRHLIDEDHQRLLDALNAMCAVNGWKLNVVQAEKLTKEEQVRVVATTTVLLGVHGNGLSHLILMAPTPISTVIELFYPGGFAHDYEWTARAMGMKHFAIQNDTVFTHPTLPWVKYPEGFQGTQIPVHAPTVINIIQDRIAGRLPNSDIFQPIERVET